MQAKGNYRWVIVALLFFATTINYLDRQVIGLLKDVLAKQFNWTETDYSNIVMAFSASYALGLLLFGRFVDAVGTKLGYIVAIIVWSLSAVAHAFARSTFSFGVARTALGLGESGNFPVAIKTVAEWFPKKDRAFATGIFNSGANVAAMIGPPLIAWLYMAYGWQWAFVCTGVIGFVWLIFWIIFYDIPSKQKRLQPAESEYIHSDEPDVVTNPSEKVKWSKLMRIRQTWAFIAGKFFTDPVWWFYLFWIPSYFNTTYGLNISKSAIYVSTIYIVSSFGSIAGGYLSGFFIRRGWPVYKARKTAMLIFACCVVPIVFVKFTSDAWLAVVLVSLAAAAHQAWSANIFTTASDMFPKKAVSSVVGIGGMAGSLGGTLFPLLIGYILDHFKTVSSINVGYNIIFVICGVAYLLAWFVMHLLAPSMQKVSL